VRHLTVKLGHYNLILAFCKSPNSVLELRVTEGLRSEGRVEELLGKILRKRRKGREITFTMNDCENKKRLGNKLSNGHT
jgi:hypothetical protein